MRIDKWYLDMASPGVTAIAYHASIRLGPLRLKAASLTLLSTSPGAGKGEPEHQLSLRAGHAPIARAGTGSWACPALGLGCEWSQAAPPFERTLLDAPKGQLDWSCLAPSCRMTMNIRDAAHTGPGYVERLRLSLPLSDIPIDELRWGHAGVGGDHIVWIEWLGPRPTRLALWNSAEAELLSCSDSLVEIGRAGEHASIELADSRVITSSPVRESVGPLRLLGLPARVLSASDTKWLSRATLNSGASGPTVGHAIHEHVVFPKE